MLHPQVQDIQRPTHPRLHVRDARDAQIILEAIRLGVLRPVVRRLNDAERSQFVRSGSVFVWEASDDELGLRRWTDGRVWSQSRMREPFLFYEEKILDESAQPLQRAQSPVLPSSNSSASLFNELRTQYSNRSSLGGLVKQAYSAFVKLPEDHRTRKWHLTAYLTYSDLAALPTIDQDPSLRSIVVPPGIYRPGKSRVGSSSKTMEQERWDIPNGSSTCSSKAPTSACGSPTNPSPQYNNNSSWVDPTTAISYIPPMPHDSTTPSHPPLRPPIALQHHPTIPDHPRDRSIEDQRVIQMLNSRHIM